MKNSIFYTCAFLFLAGSAHADFSNNSIQCMGNSTEQQEEIVHRKTIAQKLWEHQFEITSLIISAAFIIAMYYCTRHDVATLSNSNNVATDLSQNTILPNSIVENLEQAQTTDALKSLVHPSAFSASQTVAEPAQPQTPVVSSESIEKSFYDAFLNSALESKQKCEKFMRTAITFWKNSASSPEDIVD